MGPQNSIPPRLPIPEFIRAQLGYYTRLSESLRSLHYAMGFASVALSAFTAAKPEGEVFFIFRVEFTPLVKVLVPAIAAGLAFLVTTVDAKGRADRYERAAHVLRSAIARYELDEGSPLKSLADANDLAIDIIASRDQPSRHANDKSN